ncbi:MAG: response regulator [Gammaproteobacteria bacterium]|nr:response regulator [Gammaproteobacteria bacterium]
MKHEPVILIADSKEVYDEIAPVVSKELETTHIIHVDSRAAAESIIDSQIEFDIIFVDWQLVGAKFVDAIRSDSKNDCTPLVVMSELDTDEVIATATRHGASAFLAKPFLAKGLMSKINHVVVKQERRRKRRFVLDSPIAITFNTEREVAIEGVLIDISLKHCHIRLDKSLKRDLIIDDGAVIHVNIDDFKIDLDSRLERVVVDKESDEHFYVLYAFNESHGERVEKLEALLDTYQSEW